MNFKPPKDDCCVITDNIQAMKIIIDLGLLDHLVPIEGKNVCHIPFRSATHWGCASNHTGFEDEKENGYVVVMLPMSRFTVNEADAFFSDVIRQTSTGRLEYREVRVASPVLN